MSSVLNRLLIDCGATIVATPAEHAAFRAKQKETWQDDARRDLEAVVASLVPAERILYHQRVAARRAAGEHEPGIGWRALVDVRIERWHWKRTKTRVSV